MTFRREYEYACQGCGTRFRSAQSALDAQRNGCPDCGGTDIGVLSLSADECEAREREGMARRASRYGSDFLDHDHSMNA